MNPEVYDATKALKRFKSPYPKILIFFKNLYSITREPVNPRTVSLNSFKSPYGLPHISLPFGTRGHHTATGALIAG
jgi:hypothetical protein